MEPIEVVAWVWVRDNRLLGARSAGQELFYAPGGKKQDGESDEQTLVREVREELGLELDAGTARALTVIVAPAHGQHAGRTVRMACYTSDPPAGDPVASAEIEELAWLGLTDRHRCAVADQVLMDVLVERGLMR